MPVLMNTTEVDGQITLAVIDSTTGYNKVVPASHPNYAAIVTAILTEPQDVQQITDLLDPTVAIGKMLQRAFGDRVTFDLRNLWLDGFPLTGGLADEVMNRLRSGNADWERFTRFLVRLEENPSKQAKNAVWDWVQKHGVSITEDGRMVGYKGLVSGTDAVTGESNVPVSHHNGPNNFIDGVLYGNAGEAYQVPHRVGSVISKRRSDVDDDRSLACSTGLHVGAYSYAKTFGENREDGARYSTMGRMADSLPNSTFGLVAFAPEDVVSVPDGNLDWKIRVCKYEVLEFLNEVSDVLRDKSEYEHPAKVEVTVAVSAPFLPKGQEVEDESVDTTPPAFVKDPEPAQRTLADGVAESVGQVVPANVQWWEIYNEDNLGTTVYEVISGTEADAQEVLEVHDPDGEFGYDYRETDAPGEDVEEDEEQEQAYLDAEDAFLLSEDVEVEETVEEPAKIEEDQSVSTVAEVKVPSASLTLTENASLLPALAADLADVRQGHKAVARTWAQFTTESSVRRFRKAAGIKPQSALRKAVSH